VEADITAQAIELPEDLKGVGADSPRQVYLLTPPLAEETRDFELPQPYRVARAALQDNVQFIPVFGQLYDPIPMRENFLNLTLDRQRTRGLAGYYRWDAPDLGDRFEMESQPGRDSADLWDTETQRRIDIDHLNADQLFSAFPTAVIVGLPGAGKTTILRHFAWRAFEDNPHAIVVYVEARHLRNEHIKIRGKVDGFSRQHIFRVLATLFLHPGSTLRQLTRQQKKDIDDTAVALERMWVDRRAILLLDALDEAPTPDLRRWLADAANALMRVLRLDAPPSANTGLPPGRCYLSLRATELESHNAITVTDAPVFIVNALHMEQIRAIARRRLGEDSPLYKSFDDLIWRRRDIQKIAGTPLTAMLMVFFYEVHGTFARRFATYRLLVLFVLDRAWWKIKAEQFGVPRQGLNPFFSDVLREDFFTTRPDLGLQYHALAYAARRLLYHQRRGTQGDTERAVSRVELRAQLAGWLHMQRHAGSESDLEHWLEVWQRENILLPSGPERVVFVHSTVLEFLAAVDLGRLLISANAPADEFSRVFDERTRDHLETLPILCSAEHTLAWRVLARLGTQGKRGDAAGSRYTGESFSIRLLAAVALSG